MTTALAKKADKGEVMESVVIQGNLAQLSPEQRVAYYNEVCKSLQLNPLTKPFDYITLNGKLTLYARKDCTDQLRKIQCVSIVPVKREFHDDLVIVDVAASTPDGRKDYGTGAVSVANLKGDALANAIMKAETKAKRRATLSICGLGFSDESELETVPAKVVVVDQNGEIVEPAQNDTPPTSSINQTNETHCLFGKDKGTAWADMPDSKLNWYKGIFEQTIADESKATYKVANERYLRGVTTVLLNREQKKAEENIGSDGNEDLPFPEVQY